ncbi:hypothetical protein NP493_1248g02019 [Ridgeia piscesae]|uniref:NAD-dependent epimerase/dehydratase domain-containing protein n=1 Tax=Ridgeia piscesae TaxID=27915 RepID=A0AAD9KAW5_RIDPI|nr:hypothetical protein NP493_1248g02019 [Ridgeia piscesae]
MIALSRCRWLGRAIYISSVLLLVGRVTSQDEAQDANHRRVLVFGGNGFLGSATVERLIETGNDVTVVNRGNLYWDVKERIFPKVRSIICDREQNFSSCSDLASFVDSVTLFDVVIDFSASDNASIRDAAALLHEKVGLYILISTDSVYDVCAKLHKGRTLETDAVRPEDPEERVMLAEHHYYGDRKLRAEEELLGQRQDGGFPFVIIRLPDVIGPRDNTHRFWIYQLWIKVSTLIDDKPVSIPKFLTDYDVSFVYVDDVARAVEMLLTAGPQLKDHAINLAYPQTFRLGDVFNDVITELGVSAKLHVDESVAGNHFYLYPSVIRGPIDVTKAVNLLHWSPTPWREALAATVAFHEAAPLDPRFTRQFDDVIQIMAQQMFRDRKTRFFEALEQLYNVKLDHFKYPKDEL